MMSASLYKVAFAENPETAKSKSDIKLNTKNNTKKNNKKQKKQQQQKQQTNNPFTILYMFYF